MTPDAPLRRFPIALGAILAFGAFLRFYGLSWGGPFHHFHQDEHYVLSSADMLRRDPRVAAMSPKFFMYSPLLPYLINVLRSLYSAVVHRLDLSRPADEMTYVLMGRGIVATLGTATIALVFAIGRRIDSIAAGLLAALFLACSVLDLQAAHFATTDIPSSFFAVLTLWFALSVVEEGDLRSLVGAGIGFGGSILCKYSGGFVLAVVAVAYLLAPCRPRTFTPVGSWLKWIMRGLIPVVVGVALFLLLDPLVWQYFAKFRSDIREWVTDPLTGVTHPIWTAQFANLKHPELYWFTNLLWWGLGPCLELLSVVGVAWLVARREKKAAVLASFPVAYFVLTHDVGTPFVRYGVPLMPALALSAGVIGADLVRKRTVVSRAIMLVTIATTVLYALAYMNVYRQPDARLQASQWLLDNVPADSNILVEPSQNTPPMGSYLVNVSFDRDYVLWGPPRTPADRHDYYNLHTLDGYRMLYNRGPTDDDRRHYISSRLAVSDWIVIDDSYLQWYAHLPEGQYSVVKRYYRDLFAGRLGFELHKTFKTYPTLFGFTINDDSAEMTFRLFDHPRVFIFRRAITPSPRT